MSTHIPRRLRKKQKQSKLKAFRNLSSVTVHIHTNPVREVIQLTNSLNSIEIPIQISKHEKKPGLEFNFYGNFPKLENSTFKVICFEFVFVGKLY